jgi:hypothetical protein
MQVESATHGAGSGNSGDAHPSQEHRDRTACAAGMVEPPLESLIIQSSSFRKATRCSSRCRRPICGTMPPLRVTLNCDTPHIFSDPTSRPVMCIPLSFMIATCRGTRIDFRLVSSSSPRRHPGLRLGGRARITRLGYGAYMEYRPERPVAYNRVLS